MNHVEEILELVAADQPPAKDKWVVQKYSPVHGILWARILEWVALPSSKGSS